MTRSTAHTTTPNTTHTNSQGRGKPASLPWLRFSVYLLSWLYFLVGTFLVLLGILLCQWIDRSPSLTDPNLMEKVDGLIVVCFLVAVVLWLSAMDGWLVGMSRWARREVHLFTAFSALLSVLFLCLALVPLLRPQYVPNMTVQLWDRIGNRGRQRVQDWLQCCGLRTPSDRATDSASCPITLTSDFFDTTTRKGCMPTIQALLGGEYSAYVVACLFAMAFACVAGVVLGSTIQWRRRRIVGKRLVPAVTQSLPSMPPVTEPTQQPPAPIIPAPTPSVPIVPPPVPPRNLKAAPHPPSTIVEMPPLRQPHPSRIVDVQASSSRTAIPPVEPSAPPPPPPAYYDVVYEPSSQVPPPFLHFTHPHPPPSS